GFDLSGTNLALAKLERCLLTRTKLKHAWLLAADLNGANLSEADLTAADLRGADFRDSHQRGLICPDARTGDIPGLSLATRGLRR
ncbi:MAG TPA: pentapeptide repeat-containing protein, partial [Dongiaceae bacterium]